MAHGVLCECYWHWNYFWGFILLMRFRSFCIECQIKNQNLRIFYIDLETKLKPWLGLTQPKICLKGFLACVFEWMFDREITRDLLIKRPFFIPQAGISRVQKLRNYLSHRVQEIAGKTAYDDYHDGYAAGEKKFVKKLLKGGRKIVREEKEIADLVNR